MALLLQDLLNSGMSREEINALLSQGSVTSPGFDQAPMQQQMTPMQDDRPRLNSLMNLSTGRDVPITDIYGQPSRSVPMPATNMGSVPVETPYGKGRYMAGDNTRVVLNDGRIVDLGRDTGRERAIEKENLALQKQRAELAQLQAKPSSEFDKALAKGLAEAEVSKRLAGIPGTNENKRIVEQQQADEATSKRRLSAIESADSTLDAIKNAREKIGFFSTGLIGQVLRNVGNTDALDLNEALEPIRASLAFDRLQQMRDESKTGGALGQVAVQELEMLQKSKASLNQAQNQDQLEKALAKIEGHYQKYRMAMSQARANGEFGGGQAPQRSGAERQAAIIKEAQDAIAQGAPRDAVMKRLQEKLRG